MSVVLLWRIFFFSLIIPGIYILNKGLKMLRKAFYGPVLLTLPYLDQSAAFSIDKEGKYAVWYRGRLYRRIPVDKFRPRIINTKTNQEINLSFAVMGASVNSFSDGRVEMFTFHAPAGDYRLQLVEGADVPALLKFMSAIVPGVKTVDLEKFFIEIRKSQPLWFTWLAIPVILIGAFATLGGLILGIVADQLF